MSVEPPHNAPCVDLIETFGPFSHNFEGFGREGGLEVGMEGGSTPRGGVMGEDSKKRASVCLGGK